MPLKTELYRNLDLAGQKAQYDLHCKRVLANKWVLAWIMKSLIPEYAQLSTGEIRTYIEGEPEIGTVGVNPGETNAQHITGMNTEDGVPQEGTVYYDIRFYAYLPGQAVEGRKIKIILNIEAQKSFYPGYYIESRGVFYCSRMISAQLGTEFKIPDYNGIKKVYSIWLCMNPPQYIGNAVSAYSFEKEDLLPGIPDRRHAYDKISLIILCLDETSEKSSPLTRLLNTLLSPTLGTEEKKRRLGEDFNIPMENTLEKEVALMCNLSEYVEERGIRKGIELGVQQGVQALIETCREFGLSRKDTLEKSMEKLALDSSAAEEYMERYWKE